ncbi:MAG: S-layer homology domain-containing protein [Tissierellia bacterium]|nr:S-layer homology domain-containing protein [Tissierellia bacterium]
MDNKRSNNIRIILAIFLVLLSPNYSYGLINVDNIELINHPIEHNTESKGESKKEASLEKAVEEIIEEVITKKEEKNPSDSFEYGVKLAEIFSKNHSSIYDYPQKEIPNEVVKLASSMEKTYGDNIINGYLSKYEFMFYNEKLKIETNIIKETIDNKKIGFVGASGGKIISADGVMEITIPPSLLYETINYGVQTINVDNSIAKNYGTVLSNGYSVELKHKLPFSKEKVKFLIKAKTDDYKYLGVSINNKIELLESQIDEEGFSVEVSLNDLSVNTIFFIIERNEIIGFSDIDTSFAKNNIELLSAAGILKGNGKGEFFPTKPISRLEFITMLGRTLDWESTEESSLYFSDESKINYSRAYVVNAVKNGVVNGYEDGTFRPDNLITYAECQLIISRIISTDWTFEKVHQIWIKDFYNSKYAYNINSNLTREEMAYIIFKLRNGTLI